MEEMHTQQKIFVLSNAQQDSLVECGVRKINEWTRSISNIIRTWITIYFGRNTINNLNPYNRYWRGFCGRIIYLILTTNTSEENKLTCFCKGVCNRYKGERSEQHKFYLSGKKRCSICCIFLKWEGNRCPCCGALLRSRPECKRFRELFYKEKRELEANVIRR